MCELDMFDSFEHGEVFKEGVLSLKSQVSGSPEQPKPET
jgi:hypothetical protein